MRHIKRFILMIQFLTTIPIPYKIDCDEEDCGKGLAFAPVIGLLLGGMLTAFFFILKLFFSLGVISAFMLVIYILLTGGLHLDGLGDTFDGLFSNRPKERMLEIMRDSRIGTNALLGVVCIILLDYSLLNALPEAFFPRVILLFPVAGRVGTLIGAGLSVYAREGEGLGKSFVHYCTIKEVFIGILIYFPFFFLVLGIDGLLVAFLTLLTALIIVKFFSRKVNGVTGDILGAVCELNQTVFLIIICLYFRLIYGTTMG
ncbi:MAG: adenosylcobinamide-GDP ribazoletransferase [Clostridium sp.]|nr:adenosylcobinamide-GDP ribazoletransferase [Clostridium sp.]